MSYYLVTKIESYIYYKKYFIEKFKHKYFMENQLTIKVFK